MHGELGVAEGLGERAAAGLPVLRAAATSSTNAATTAGSNCVPAQRSSSAHASSSGMRARYGRSWVIALKESTTQMIRASSGICSPRRRAG